jgi:hypothetical protein
MAKKTRSAPVFNCRETPAARKQLDAFAEIPRFNELWEGIEWLIRRDPIKAGRCLDGYNNTYVLKSKDFMAIKMPIVLVIYSIVGKKDEPIVEIVEVVEAPSKVLKKVPKEQKLKRMLSN